MYWSDKLALELKKRNLPLEWVDDMKTPSGRVHVGALIGVAVHGLIYESLKKAKVNTKYTTAISLNPAGVLTLTFLSL